MSPVAFALAAFGTSAVGGLLGALLGLGGGIIIVPVLTLGFGVDIRFAIGASIVAVIATSSGAAAAYVKDRMSNLRVAMFLELGTTTGAIAGASLAGHLATRWLFLLFGAVLAYSALAMLKKAHTPTSVTAPPDRLASFLRLDGAYHDEAAGQQVTYQVGRAPLGLLLMIVAGAVSGLLGIGSGSLKVPAMDLAMGMPIKASAATSNFMIGVTAAASAGVYFARGDIVPLVAAPVTAGVLLGATLGTRVMARIGSAALRWLFVVVLLAIAGQMLVKGIR